MWLHKIALEIPNFHSLNNIALVTFKEVQIEQKKDW